MARSLLLITVAVISLIKISYAEDCRIVEYANRVELICNGTQQHKNYYEAPARRAIVQSLREVQQITTVNSCRMLQANHYDVTRNSTVEVEVSCSVNGQDLSFVEFLLYGLGGNKERLSTTLMSGNVDGHGFGDLKKTFPVAFTDFVNIHIWEPDTSGSTLKIAETYLFNESETRSRIAQINKAVEVREAEEASAYLSQNTNVSLKKGVIFRHSAHSKASCVVCHIGSPPDKIPGFNKDWAHKTCKGCHTELKAGPTNCKGCHKS